MRRSLSGIFAIVLLTAPVGAVFSQNDFFNTVDIAIAPPSSATSSHSLFGWITQKAGYGLEAPGAPFSRQDRDLSKVETSLFAQFDTDISDTLHLRFSGKAYRDLVFSLNESVDYTADERNKLRTRFEIKDFYVEHQFANGLYVKLGNQILAWGLGEYSRVTDLINTEDQLTLGQQDLEDLRLQVPAALLSFGWQDWTLDGVVTYRAGRNDTAPARDEFDPLLRLRDSGTSISRSQPDKPTEMFFRASTHWSRGDIQLVAGEFNDNALSVSRVDLSQGADPNIVYSQNRMRALGMAGNWVNGSWLYFGEVGLHKDKAVAPAAPAFFGRTRGWDQKDQVLTVAGAEYNGFRNLILTAELDHTHIRAHDALLLEDRDQLGFGVRVYWTLLNERLKLIAVRNDLVDAGATINRVSADYSWSDNLAVGFLWMQYSADRNSQFYDYRNNDVIQLQLQYNFQF